MTYEIYDQYGTIRGVNTKEEALNFVRKYNRESPYHHADYKEIGLGTKIIRAITFRKSLEKRIAERTKRIQGLDVARTIQQYKYSQNPKRAR